jgi:hypothetical protein
MPVSVRRNMHAGERGSALLLVAVLLIFAGFLLSLGVGHFQTQDQFDRIQITAQRQQLIVDELAAYAQRENKIPCPASPSVSQTVSGFGFSMNTAQGTPTTAPADPNSAGTCLTSTTYEGIVPFRTLGLEPYDAMDGWGRFMTYHVSPIMANPYDGFTSTSIQTTASVYLRCRRFPWYDDGVHVYSAGYYGATPANTYPDKAAFCCPPDNGTNFPAGNTSNDIQILSSAGGAAIDSTIGRSKSTTWDAPMDLLTTPTGYEALPTASTYALYKQEIYAFILVSHGADGFGAYNADGTTNRLTGSTSLDEQKNYSNTGTFVTHAMNFTPGANYFDDMVVYRTQINLMGELSNASCYLPWR